MARRRKKQMASKPQVPESELRWRECESKTFYQTFTEADQQRARMPRRSGEAPLQTYKCRFCTGYHFGHDWKNWLK